MISIPGSQEMDTAGCVPLAADPGRFFATAEAAQGWLAQHPTVRCCPVADAYLQLRPIRSRLLTPPETRTC